MLKDSAKPKPERQLKLVIQISSPASLWLFFQVPGTGATLRDVNLKKC